MITVLLVLVLSLSSHEDLVTIPVLVQISLHYHCPCTNMLALCLPWHLAAVPAVGEMSLGWHVAELPGGNQGKAAVAREHTELHPQGLHCTLVAM